MQWIGKVKFFYLSVGNMTQQQPGKIYVVATPIGNLEDISMRALATLKEVDLIAAEDTRHTGQLCRHLGIETRLISMHAYNEKSRVDALVRQVQEGVSLAVVSDAGTPLISDPGFLLVRSAAESNLDIVPVPGPSAFVAALSVAGLPSNRFTFEGFLPAKRQARMSQLQGLRDEERTLIFYESPHRILELLADCRDCFGGRPMVLARELTKTFETILRGTADELLGMLQDDSNQQRGEFVVLVEGAPQQDVSAMEVDADLLLQELLAELPTKKAAAITAKVTGLPKNALYAKALEYKS